MPITILKGQTVKFTLPLIDNEGNTYTTTLNTVRVYNDTPGIMSLTWDDETLTGEIKGLENGLGAYHFQALTLKGKGVIGSDKVLVADELAAADANQMVALYQLQLS